MFKVNPYRQGAGLMPTYIAGRDEDIKNTEQMCQVVYKNTDDKTIQECHIDNNIEEFFDLLDIGFFKVRYERCSDGEKKLNIRNWILLFRNLPVIFKGWTNINNGAKKINSATNNRRKSS